MEKPVDLYLVKLNRIIVWPLVVLIVLLGVSGYGIINPDTVSELTGGLLTRASSLDLHSTLDVPTLGLLAVHVLLSMRSAMIRWRVKDRVLLDVFLVALGIFVVVLLALMEGVRFW